MDFIIATHNLKKRDELQRILSPLGINVFTADEKGIVLTDAEETGETFAQNAFIKAESGCRESGMPCIADDSGLMVDYLDGAPGVFSARFSGEHGNDKKNNDKLLLLLEGVPYEKRTARFVSAVCCVFPDGRRLEAEGKCEGVIAFERHGDNGFGYDPLFMVGDKSFAEMTKEEKDSISHRGNALREFVKILHKYLDNE